MIPSVSLLENTNLWKRFVAFHCFDTHRNNFFLIMGFEALYYTLIHWLKNKRCIWRQENQADVREVLISGWAGQPSVRKATFLFWAQKDKSSFLTHSSNKTPVIQLFFGALYRQGSCFTFLKLCGLCLLTYSWITILRVLFHSKAVSFQLLQ